MITHDKYLVNVEEEVELFLDIIEPLLNKTLALLIQLPPWRLCRDERVLKSPTFG
jgi:uncharacterized protein YecE (DUF72 family)